MKLLLFIAASLVSSMAIGDTIIVMPPSPTISTPVTIRVDGVSTALPLGAFLRQFSIQNDLIRIEGCYPTPSFSGPTNYSFLVSVGLLPRGEYTVQYVTARCDLSGNPLESFVVQASATLNLLDANNTEAVPALGIQQLALLALLLVGAGLTITHSRHS